MSKGPRLHPADHTFGKDSLIREVNKVPRVALAKVSAQTPLRNRLADAPGDRSSKFLPNKQVLPPVNNQRVVDKVFLLEELTLVYPMLGFQVPRKRRRVKVEPALITLYAPFRQVMCGVEADLSTMVRAVGKTDPNLAWDVCHGLCLLCVG